MATPKKRSKKAQRKKLTPPDHLQNVETTATGRALIKARRK